MEFGFGAQSGNHSSITRAHLISLGGERRLASEKERQVGGRWLSGERFCFPAYRMGSGSPREGKSAMLILEMLGSLIPEDGGKGQGPLERNLSPL